MCIRDSPNVRQAYDMLGTARALTLPTGYPLLTPGWKRDKGPFGHSKWTYSVRFPDALDKFQTKLQEIEKTVVARNAKRKWPYRYLQPSRIPSSMRFTAASSTARSFFFLVIFVCTQANTQAMCSR